MTRAGHVDIVYVEIPDREPFAWRNGHVLEGDQRAAVHRDFVAVVTNASRQHNTRLGRYVLSWPRLLVEFPVTGSTGQRLKASLVVTAPAEQPGGWTQAAATEAAAILSEGGLTADPANIDRLLALAGGARRPLDLSYPMVRGTLAALVAVALYLLIRKLMG